MVKIILSLIHNFVVVASENGGTNLKYYMVQLGQQNKIRIVEPFILLYIIENAGH